ncbi:hypothetical protein D3C87_1853990 [compost metagenome]
MKNPAWREPRLLGNNGQMPLQPARRGHQRQFGIAEQVGIVVTAVANNAFRVDRQPAAIAEIENIGVVNVTVQHDGRFRIGK